jgi:hypothetical protein
MRAKLKNLTDVVYHHCTEYDQGHTNDGRARHWKVVSNGRSMWITEFYFGKEVCIKQAYNRQRQPIEDLFNVVSRRGNVLFKAWREWFEWITPAPIQAEPENSPIPSPEDVWKLENVFVKDPNQIPEWVDTKVKWEPPKTTPTNLNSLTWDELFDV